MVRVLCQSPVSVGCCAQGEREGQRPGVAEEGVIDRSKALLAVQAMHGEEDSNFSSDFNFSNSDSGSSSDSDDLGHGKLTIDMCDEAEEDIPIINMQVNIYFYQFFVFYLKILRDIKDIS